jgi:tetratricopeptide (TPR) repeat protein
METPEWNPAIGITIQSSLKKLGITVEKKLQHIVEKYFGDLNKYIGNYPEAKLHYEKALVLKPNYIDALYSYGWFSYSVIPDLKNMELIFSKMVEANIYDFRGFHGYGYALYIPMRMKTMTMIQHIEKVTVKKNKKTNSGRTYMNR